MHLVGIVLYSSLLVQGMSLALLNGSLAIGSIKLATNIIITICGILMFSANSKNILSEKFAAWFVVYVAAVTLFTIIIKGLEFTPFPKFNFEYTSSFQKQETAYSQELSKFFGYGAAAAAVVYVNQKNKLIKYIFFFIAVIFLFLSFVGGARGDSVAALFVVVSYLVISNPVRFLLWLALIVFAVYFGVQDWAWLNNFTIFERLLDLKYNLGYRDILLAQSFELLFREPSCLVFGCGFGYFQLYFSYPYDLYPHNVLVESVIVFGIPIALVYIFSIAGGLWLYLHRCGRLDLLILFFVYSLLVGLKSGALFQDWFFTAGCIYFSSVYFHKMVIRNHAPYPAMVSSGVKS